MPSYASTTPLTPHTSATPPMISNSKCTLFRAHPVPPTLTRMPIIPGKPFSPCGPAFPWWWTEQELKVWCNNDVIMTHRNSWRSNWPFAAFWTLLYIHKCTHITHTHHAYTSHIHTCAHITHTHMYTHHTYTHVHTSHIHTCAHVTHTHMCTHHTYTYVHTYLCALGLGKIN